MYEITNIEENHWEEHGDLCWKVFIDGGGPDLSIMKACNKDYYEICIHHIGDDHRINESQWCDVFKDIYYEKYKSYEDTLTAIKNTLILYKK